MEVSRKPPKKPFANKDRKHLMRPSSPFVGMNKKPFKSTSAKPLKPKARAKASGNLSKEHSLPKPQKPK